MQIPRVFVKALFIEASQTPLYLCRGASMYKEQICKEQSLLSTIYWMVSGQFTKKCLSSFWNLHVMSLQKFVFSTPLPLWEANSLKHILQEIVWNGQILAENSFLPTPPPTWVVNSLNFFTKDWMKCPPFANKTDFLVTSPPTRAWVSIHKNHVLFEIAWNIWICTENHLCKPLPTRSGINSLKIFLLAMTWKVQILTGKLFLPKQPHLFGGSIHWILFGKLHKYPHLQIVSYPSHWENGSIQ